MNAQIDFLQSRDEDLARLISQIKIEELEHLHYAQEKVKHSRFTKYVARIIYSITEVLIWLSTQGDIKRMKRDLNQMTA